MTNRLHCVKTTTCMRLRNSRSGLRCNIVAVTTGGFLFKHYLDTATGDTSNARWRRLLRTTRDGDDVSVEDMFGLTNEHGRFFKGFVMHHLVLLGKKAGRDLSLALTPTLAFHGLSQTGIKILRSLGLVSGISTHKKRIISLKETCRERARYVCMI